MRVKRVPLQDLELWPDEVICFTAYTDTRNPVQQRRTYVDGSRYAELQVENAKLRDLMYKKAHEHSIQHMTEDELRIMATSLMSENEKLRDWCGEILDSLMPEICANAYWCEEKDWRTCNDDSCGNYSFVIISRELGIEVPE